jgi:peptidoglycan hydrolase-like protein with peptidoglycan-binding domain
MFKSLKFGPLATVAMVLAVAWVASPSVMLKAAQGSANVKKAQQSLQSKGYYKGQIDGLMGPATRSAIRQYQKAEHLHVTGTLDNQTASKLGVQPMTMHMHHGAVAVHARS